MANVVPALVDGLLDICKVQPDDPVDYLAEYLFNRATNDTA
jgi:adenylate kinase